MQLNWILRATSLLRWFGDVVDVDTSVDFKGELPFVVDAVPAVTGVQSHHKKFPVVIWHGLGDNYNSSGMVEMEEIINQIHPDITVYRIRLDDDPSEDQKRSLLGDMNHNLKAVCEELGSILELHGGFDAIGNSQGGLFLRALQETCANASIHHLITFGSPHMGVMDLPICSNPHDWVCKRRNELLKRQVWNRSIQNTIVPAQYFRDPYQYEKYKEHSSFLAAINNESTEGYLKAYADKLRELSKFVMILFASDTTLVPKTSAIFGDIDVQTGAVIPMYQTKLYKENLLGMRDLDQRGALEFFELEGDHMQIPQAFFVNVVNDYLGFKMNRTMDGKE